MADNTTDVVVDVKRIVEQSRSLAYHYVNKALILRNWLLGKRISEEILQGDNKENYGKNLITNLSKRLTSDYGKGFDEGRLYKYVRFYETFPDILSTLWTESFSVLSWSHYRTLMQIKEENVILYF